MLSLIDFKHHTICKEGQQNTHTQMIQVRMSLIQLDEVKSHGGNYTQKNTTCIKNSTCIILQARLPFSYTSLSLWPS
jgi:hypothetical protein